VTKPTDPKPGKSRNGSWNFSGGNDDSEAVLNFRSPEAARLDCLRWYQMIYPPSVLPMVDGADCDWPGPDYETTEHEIDLRHPGARKTNGKVYP